MTAREPPDTNHEPESRTMNHPHLPPVAPITLVVDEAFNKLVKAYRATKEDAQSHQAKTAAVSKVGHYDLDGCATTTADSLSAHRIAEQRAAMLLADAVLARVHELKKQLVK